ncbi:exosortase-associated EpsI family protein [Candidatus Uabimicrobium sp. HlEnr_7]|uniref:exosortase-associated EpsI family protein n=1 Tax=Candidatus Uabimicrobium helgolandensis TaxID=3095367 RepID=UPI0035571A20
MRYTKYLLATTFLALALYTWLNDTSWLNSVEDTVPLFMSFVLFFWLAKPWEITQEQYSFSGAVPMISLLLLSSGFILGSTFILACCVCSIAWLWFNIFAPKQGKHHLIVFLFFAFPWIALDAEKIGWIFRISGATFAYKFFTLIGFPAEQQGTSLIVSGVFLSVDSACAGISTLQAILILGFAILHMRLQEKLNVPLNLFLLTLLAWWANTLRIVLIGFAALVVGEEFALGLFHTWGSLILLTFMFGFTFTIAFFQEKWQRFFSEKIITTISFCYILFNLRELFAGWWRSPLEQYGWLVLTLWLLPCVFRLYKDREIHNNFALLSLAVFCTFLGQIGDLNTLCYLGFAIFVYSITARINFRGALWGVCAVVWMPAFSWFTTYYIVNYILILKLIIVGSTSLLVMRKSPPKSARSFYKPQVAATFTVLLIVVCIWPFLPYKTQDRLSNLSRKGFGFISQDIALTQKEQSSFGKAKVIKRFYRVGKQRFVLLAIDGTKDRHAVHDPNYCIVGAGWQIVATREIQKDLGTIRWVKLQRKKQVKEVVYWFSNQQSTYSSPIRYWYETTIRRISLGYLYKEPILIILQTVDKKNVDWNRVLSLMPQIQEL